MPRGIVEPGQSWAIRDDRYEGWRYVTVERVEPERVQVRPDFRGGRRSIIRRRRFRTVRFAYCGRKEPGLDVPPYFDLVGRACLSCPPRPPQLSHDEILTTGFGIVTVTRSGFRVYTGADRTRYNGDEMADMAADRYDPRKIVTVAETVTVGDVEAYAALAPRDDWRIQFTGAMSDSIYQRQAEGWVLIWRGMGFA